MKLCSGPLTAEPGQLTVLSSHGPVFEMSQPPERWFWLAVERAVEMSAPRWTHIRPSAVMASMLVGGYPPTGSSWAAMIRRGQVIREPNLDAAYPFVDADDVAAVAAAALLGTADGGRVIEADGPPISARARAALISDAIGTPVRLEELSPDEARRRWLEEGWPAETIEVTLWAQTEFLAHPLPPNPTIDRVLGRPARTFPQWLASHRDAFC